MESIGVRELRQNASVYLERVKKGESIQVTERGEPVAILSPAQPISTWDRLVAEGKIIPAETDFHEWLDEPRPPGRPGEPTLSEVLQELREDRL